MQCCEAPVDAAEAEVFCEVVFELIAALLWALVVSVRCGMVIVEE